VNCAVVLFNRDLRVHDHPALHHAAGHARRVVPLFVLDPALVVDAPNRLHFLLDCLEDHRARLRERGGDLLVASGDTVDETMRIAKMHGAQAVFASADVTRRARRRQTRLADACARERLEWRTFPGATVVPPGELAPVGGDHYRVFTPFWRAWQAASHRRPLPAPRRLEIPTDLAVVPVPSFGRLGVGRPSPQLPAGGESVARRMVKAWGRDCLGRYADRHDDLATDGTSRLSPYLHFGCVSALEVAARFEGRDGGEALVRQLCWRDFFHQVTAAFDAIATEDYRPRRDRWLADEDAFQAWADGRTGYPIVDAGMRQLKREGWMHNRARLITASFLTKDLDIDWRHGARHFMNWLVDGDVANNSGNWQWVAGTGNDTRPNRVFNPLRQAARFDPSGDYVRRYVTELGAVPGPPVHQPWALESSLRATLDYPEPIVDHAGATARSRAARRGR
jgi:deoxyribodipyrimidine photo-lyase